MMSDYLSSFIIEPVVRQARRISGLNSGEETPGSGILPAVPESLRTWYPSRLWNTSPPQSVDDDESKQAERSNAGSGSWAAQLPSPPLDPMETAAPARADARSPTVIAFPPLEPQIAQLSLRPARLQALRGGNQSETSFNPSHELPDRSRIHENATRDHAQSDPLTRLRAATVFRNQQPGIPEESALPQPTRDPSNALPEDDGMSEMRYRIGLIWNGDGTNEEKSQQIHNLMMQSYNTAKRRTQKRAGSPLTKSTVPGTPVDSTMIIEERSVTPLSLNSDTTWNLRPEDLIPTYAPLPPPNDSDEHIDSMVDHDPISELYGCTHYRRNVKIQCNTCHRWYPCRLCHDAIEDHRLPRKETKNMLCMLCTTPQPASQTCINCGLEAANYYCPVCHLWNDDPTKSIYHCPSCEICRLGEGLGRDFFHCDVCCVCVSLSHPHRCVEASTKCDCPICGEYMFDSAESVSFMRCGHGIHEECFEKWCKTSYRCPICSKSVVNMASQFTLLDRQIDSQKMPDEYRNTRAYVYCNDCEGKSTTAYHWVGLKCAKCDSYNTSQIETFEIQDNNEDGKTRQHPVEARRVEAQPRLPDNTTDEAVSIPNSRAGSRRASAASSRESPAIGLAIPRGLQMTRMPSPSSQGSASVRARSPIVGSYFGTGTGGDRRGSVRSDTITTATEDDQEELDFWGRRSPRSDTEDLLRPPEYESETDSDDSSPDPRDFEDEDDDEEEDRFSIFGHR